MDIIDSSGSSPRLRIGALVSVVSGTLIWSGYVALSDWIDSTIGLGIGAIGDFAAWLNGSVVPGIVDIGTSGIESAVAANVEWVSTLGIIGPIVASIEILVVIYLLLLGIRAVPRLIRGLLST